MEDQCDYVEVERWHVFHKEDKHGELKRRAFPTGARCTKEAVVTRPDKKKRCLEHLGKP